MQITPQIQIDEEEIKWTFARSGGPGGQNVNKVNSKAQLRWNISANNTIPDQVKQRIHAREKRRITTDGELILISQRSRDQERNREDCLEKLRTIILKALEKPKPRKKTRPSKGAIEARLKKKKQRSQRKAMRQKYKDDY